MSEKITWKRRILNSANKLLSPLQVRLSSSNELRAIEATALLERLITESKYTAIVGTISAFCSYLQIKKHETENGDRLLNNSQFVLAPNELARLVGEASRDRTSPVDDFMAYYAEHHAECNSQWSQDIFVSYICNRKTFGKYFEIGGADGITHSNTFSLENRFGWSGLIAEPHPQQYSILTSSRQRKHNVILNCAASQNSACDHVELTDAWQLSTTTSPSESDLHTATRMGATKKHIVKAVPFRELLAICGSLDYLSLDVEGPEYELLASVDWTTTPLPAVITVEHNWRHDTIKKLRNLLSELGYQEFFQNETWLTRGDLWFSNLPFPCSR